MKRILVLCIVAFLVAALPVSAGPWRGFVLGDVNNDGAANSTDFAIILSADAGMANTKRFCPWLQLGDVNGDWRVNSTDALIVLVADAGVPVRYPVGWAVGWFPFWVQPPLACR